MKKENHFSIFAFLLSVIILITSCTSPTNTKPIDSNDVNGGTNTGDAVVKKVNGTQNNISDRIDSLKTDK